MSYQEDKLKEIADAIREKKGTTGTINASDFVSEIQGIQSKENLDAELNSLDSSLDDLETFVDSMEENKLPVLISKEFNQNGNYSAINDNADGYKDIIIKVPIPEGYVKPEGHLEIKENVENYDVTNIKTVTVAIESSGGGEFFDRTFANNTPEQISKVSALISYHNMTSAEVAETFGWNIGDTTKITLSTGEVIEMRIIGFNHDTRTGGGMAGITLEMTHCLATSYKMSNATSSNAGGYPAGTIRTEILPTIKSTLPQEWQNAIKLVDKKSANGGYSNYSETLTISEDIFLLSAIELNGTGYIQDRANEGATYEYWQNKSNTNRIKYNDLDGDGTYESKQAYWTRSCYSMSTADFWAVGSNGGELSRKPQYALPISFAFCI